MVLASCQSAGGGTPERSADGGALAALGPRLARAGAAAVLAMQDDVAMTTAAAFLPAFFRELRRPEWLWQVDRAAAVARGAVADEQERWKPVLFMRLKNGRLWHVPQTAQPWPKFEKWPSVLNNIYQERCTPVLGPGLLEAFIGPARQLAHDWARDHGFPLAAYLQEDLAQVAQYLAVIQQVGFPRERLARHIRERLLADPQLRTPAGPLPSPDNLDDLISAVGRVRRERDPAEPHRVLARLPSKVYITANPDRLLADALRGAGRDPRVDLCPWSDEVDWPRPVQEREPNYTPTREQPLIYHLFGHFALPESLVLTQDDYFDFLIGVTRNKALIPKPILRARADTALLFLGFRMDDWNFKVLFRSIMSQEAGRRRTQYAHVGVQIDPAGTEFADPGRARQYLERYFQDADLSIFWGSVEDFIRQLQERLE